MPLDRVQGKLWTRCTICHEATPGTDDASDAWCAWCFAAHIATGERGPRAVRGERTMAERTPRRELQAWLGERLGEL